MRPLKSHFPAHALTTLDTMLKQTKEARVFRRAQAVREVVAGHHINAVSEAFHLANSALRKWVQRFAQAGPQGLVDRPRSGRPPKITCELEQHLNRLVDQDPLQHGSLYSQWSCRELATVLLSGPRCRADRINNPAPGTHPRGHQWGGHPPIPGPCYQQDKPRRGSNGPRDGSERCDPRTSPDNATASNAARPPPSPPDRPTQNGARRHSSPRWGHRSAPPHDPADRAAESA